MTIMPRPLRIAIADDESDMRDYLEKLLPRLGFEVVAVAENGRELIELCQVAKPDLIISDIRMPEMDGDEAIRILSEQRTVPFIAISAFSKPLDFGNGLPLGSWIYLHKPVKRDALIQAITSLFPDTTIAPKRVETPHDAEEDEWGRLDMTSQDSASSTSSAEKPLMLLIVDDDPEFRNDLRTFLVGKGHQVITVADGKAALQESEARVFDAVVLDLMMPEFTGMDLLRAWKQDHRDGELIVLTGQGTIESAVEAIKLGASDFLTKPIKLSDLESTIRRVAAGAELKKVNRQLRVALQQQHAHTPMIGKSPAMQEVFRMIEKVSQSDRPVLIQGESGTGKELVARAIHEASPLRDNPLVVINCAALPETLLESELFGHEKGAFTGAFQAKPGLFEIADGGTLFIDEIGELAGSLQAKLLRVLEDGSLRRIGSIKERRTRVRLIAATNRDMVEEVRKGNFREDLYYRISVLTLHLPPLRDRPDDLPLLIRHFAGSDWQVEQEVFPFVQQYTWPGNVRQLANAIERAKILSDDETIHVRDFPPELLRVTQKMTPFSAESVISSRKKPDADHYGSSPESGMQDLDALTKIHVLDAYERCHRNKSRTARLLGINRRSLYRLLERYGV